MFITETEKKWNYCMGKCICIKRNVRHISLIQVSPKTSFLLVSSFSFVLISSLSLESAWSSRRTNSSTSFTTSSLPGLITNTLRGADGRKTPNCKGGKQRQEELREQRDGEEQFDGQEQLDPREQLDGQEHHQRKIAVRRMPGSERRAFNKGRSWKQFAVESLS